MKEKIENHMLTYLENRNKRIKMIEFLGKFSVIGGTIVTLILVFAIITR